MTTASKYHVLPLFTLADPDVEICAARLNVQPRLYQGAGELGKKKMQCRALMVCAFTLNATAVWTAKLLMRGTFSMRTQRRFFEKRWRQHPSEWGETAKSCFARAICGYSIKKDGVCIDRHLERTGSQPPNAEGQWREWFRLYEIMYGAGEAMFCVRWHIGLLDWVAMRAPKPEPWK